MADPVADDLELLRRHEPIVRYTLGETFFPMDVTTYMAAATLWERLPDGSVRALAALKRQRLVHRIGLCNVTVGQIEEARAIVEIDAIQVELSLWHDQHLLSGVVQYCLANRLQLLAHRPLGGTRSRSRTANHPVLGAIAADHGATPFDVALAWLAR